MRAADVTVKHEIDAIYIIVFYLQIYFCYCGKTKFFAFYIIQNIILLQKLHEIEVVCNSILYMYKTLS